MADPTRQYVRESGARNEAVAQSMQESRDTGVCPFCRVVAETEPSQRIHGWVVIKNLSPEEFSRSHYVVISEEHPESGHFDDLPYETRSGREAVIELLASADGLKDWGYSDYTRRGANGKHNAMTIYHPHFHVIASDGAPVTIEQVNRQHRVILGEERGWLIEIFQAMHPEKAAQAKAEGEDALFSAALKDFVRSVNLYRSALEGKAGQILVKLSNEAD